MANVKTAEAERTNALKKLYAERERYTGRDGKEYWSYYVKGTARGKEIKANLIASDRGGYEVLDLVYGGGEDTAELIIVPYEFKNDDGKTISGDNYVVRNTDKKTGEVYEADIKFAQKSDKRLFDMIIGSSARIDKDEKYLLSKVKQKTEV
ncbi:MAG: hypothetical protein LBP79_04050 [Clostridiales bacterium]|jgi:hypothetical protein|nr:hypothetical protein [Clostridiales bacterium]